VHFLTILIVATLIMAGAPLPMTGQSASATEDGALAPGEADPDPVNQLAGFLKRYPDSCWQPPVLAELWTHYRASGR